MIRRTIWLMRRGSIAVLVLGFAVSSYASQPPHGKFQCRRNPPSSHMSPYVAPVAYIWLEANSTYTLLDLTSTKGKSSGEYSYDSSKQQVNWKTGDLSKYVGHYIPHIEGTAVIKLNTKADPEGRVEGTMLCVRVPDEP